MVKIGSFWGQKWRHKSKFWEIGQKNFSIKVSKIISFKFMDIYLVENVINGVNLAKIGHFWWKWSNLGHFWGKNDVISQNLGIGLKEILLYMFLIIILVNFMDIYLVKNDINGVNLVKIGHFWWKWSNLGHFGGKNDVISQNFG